MHKSFNIFFSFYFNNALPQRAALQLLRQCFTRQSQVTGLNLRVISQAAWFQSEFELAVQALMMNYKSHVLYFY